MGVDGAMTFARWFPHFARGRRGRRAGLAALAVLAVAPWTSSCKPVGTVADAADAAAVRTFEFRYESMIKDVPASAETVYLWIPHPETNEDQTIRNLTLETSLPYEIVTEPKYGNRAVRLAVPPGTDAAEVALVFLVDRRERLRRPGEMNLEPEEGEDPSLWLKPDKRVPLNDQIRAWAQEAVGPASAPLEVARAIYDYAVTNMSYNKDGTGWGNGDIYWACDSKRGNCTDFHAMFIGFNRALGVPARFEMGFPIPPDRGEGEIGGYHCWAQFHLEDAGWIPVDASEANKHPENREYFFGAHDENRVLFTLGRDLTLPGMQGEPLNYFIYPYAEVDGQPYAAVERRFTYRDTEAS